MPANPRVAKPHSTQTRQGSSLKLFPLRGIKDLFARPLGGGSRFTATRVRHQQLDTPTVRLHAHCPLRFCITGGHSSQETCCMHQSLHNTSSFTPCGLAPRRAAPMCAQGGQPGRPIKTLWNPSFLAAAQTPGSLWRQASHPRGCSSVLAPWRVFAATQGCSACFISLIFTVLYTHGYTSFLLPKVVCLPASTKTPEPVSTQNQHP